MNILPRVLIPTRSVSRTRNSVVVVIVQTVVLVVVVPKLQWLGAEVAADEADVLTAMCGMKTLLKSSMKASLPLEVVAADSSSLWDWPLLALILNALCSLENELLHIFHHGSVQTMDKSSMELNANRRRYFRGRLRRAMSHKKQKEQMLVSVKGKLMY